MMYREIVADIAQIHTKHIDIACGHNVKLLSVNLSVHLDTSVL